MPSETQKATVVGKPVSALVLRVGSHPIVYSVVALFIVGAASFFLIIVPLVRSMQSGGAASAADAALRHRVASDRFESEKKIIGNVASLSAADRDLLAYALPVEADTPGLSVQLNAIGASSGVRITGIDVAKPADEVKTEKQLPPGIRPVDVAVSIDNASYEKIKLFLAAIDNSLRIMDVRNMNYSPGTDSASLDIRTYYMK